MARYRNPPLTTDVAVFILGARGLEVLLIERLREPFRDCWCLPGGFVDYGEDLDDAARRELAEETALTARRLVQVGAYGHPDRDPRGHTVSVAYFTAMRDATARRRVAAGDDAAEVAFHSVDRPPRLGFDHARILRDARRKLAERARHEPLVADLLPTRFTVEELRRGLTATLGQDIPARTLRSAARRAPWLVRHDDGRLSIARAAWRATPPAFA